MLQKNYINNRRTTTPRTEIFLSVLTYHGGTDEKHHADASEDNEGQRRHCYQRQQEVGDKLFVYHQELRFSSEHEGVRSDTFRVGPPCTTGYYPLLLCYIFLCIAQTSAHKGHDLAHSAGATTSLSAISILLQRRNDIGGF